jgi:hypothetical protein
MSHLTLETIARLVEEKPNAEETAHLDGCAVCRAELDAMREDVQALSMLPDMTPPPDSWAALEHRLEGEGLLVRRRSMVAFPRLAWAAAAVVLFVAGTMAGRLTVGPAQQVATHVPATVDATDAAVVAGPTGDDVPEAVTGPRTTQPQVAAHTEPPADPATSPAAAPGPAPGVTLASNVFGAAQPRTLDEAATLLRQTEELYLAALTRYAELATQAEPGDPVSRLAALQSIVMTTQAALTQAPADPVINGYHLTALAQRDATLRQVAAASSDRWY